MPLTRWMLRRDPAGTGPRRGWARGGFSAPASSVPNVVNPTPYSGRAGARNYEGSVAWYRTSFQAPAAGRYALSFASANFRANVCLDGKPLGSHRGSYLPFDLPGDARARRAHAGRARRLARPAAPGRRRLSPHVVQLGRARRRGRRAPDRRERAVGAHARHDARRRPTASVKVGVQVRNNGPARTIAPEGSLVRPGQTIPLSFPAVALAHGESATVTRDRDRRAARAVVARRPRTCTRSSWRCRARAATRRASGLRQLTWHGQELFLNGQHLMLHGASHPGGRARPRRRADARRPGRRRRRARGDRRERGPLPAPARPGAARTARRGRDPRVAGRRPGRRRGQLVLEHPAAARRSRAAGAHGRARAPQLHPSIIAWNLVDEVAGNGRDAAEVSYVRDSTRWLHAHDPGRMVASTCGATPAREARARSTAESTRSPRPTTPAGTTRPHDSPAQLAARMRARLAAMQRTFPGKVLVISEFGAESNTLNPPGRPGQLRLPVAPARQNHIAGLRRRPGAHGDARLGPARLPAHADLQRRLDPPRAPAPAADRRDQPEGPVHLRREAQAGRAVVARLFKALPT